MFVLFLCFSCNILLPFRADAFVGELIEIIIAAASGDAHFMQFSLRQSNVLTINSYLIIGDAVLFQ